MEHVGPIIISWINRHTFCSFTWGILDIPDVEPLTSSVDHPNTNQKHPIPVDSPLSVEYKHSHNPQMLMCDEQEISIRWYWNLSHTKLSTNHSKW